MATIGLALQARELGCLSGNNLCYPVYQVIPRSGENPELAENLPPNPEGVYQQ